MSNENLDFEEWFALLANFVLDKTGQYFIDKDYVRDDYLRGYCYLVVGVDIAEEYLCDNPDTPNPQFVA